MTIETGSLPFNKLKLHQLPDEPCLYWMYSDNLLLYIGSTTNLRQRVRWHEKKRVLRDIQDAQICWVVIYHREVREELETVLIYHKKPVLNKKVSTPAS